MSSSGIRAPSSRTRECVKKMVLKVAASYGLWKAKIIFICYDAIREDIIALGQAYTLEHITGMKEGRMVI